MKNEQADQWIEALESGDYKQTNDMLFRPEDQSFCCLGVLTNEYCETNGANFSEITKLEDRFVGNFNDKAAFDFSDIYGDEPSDELLDEVIRESLEDAIDEALRTTTINSKVTRWVGLRSKVDVSKLKSASHFIKRELDNANLLPNSQGECRMIEVTNFLGKLNDDGVSFAKIAHFLRTNKSVLFTRKK